MRFDLSSYDKQFELSVQVTSLFKIKNFFTAMRSIDFNFQTIEMENAAGVRGESIQNRKCRFSDERQLPAASLPYSFASCLTYARIQTELNLCNCTIHTSPIECIESPEFLYELE